MVPGDAEMVTVLDRDGDDAGLADDLGRPVEPFANGGKGEADPAILVIDFFKSSSVKTLALVVASRSRTLGDGSETAAALSLVSDFPWRSTLAT